MYHGIYSCLVENNLEKLIDEPFYVDMDGKECEEKYALGRKITHHFLHSEMCVVFDETGGDTS